MEKEVWIALACVTPLPGNEHFHSGQGVYVYMLAPAADDMEFLALARQTLAERKFKVGQIEQAEPFSLHQVKYEVTESLLSLARQARDTGQLQVGRFHVFGEQTS